MDNRETKRRTFLKSTAASAGALAFSSTIPHTVLGANDRVRFGVIGCGGMGGGHLERLIERKEADNIEVTAVCDVYQRRLSHASALAGAAGHMDYRELLDRDDVDAVLIATPDHWHSKISIDAMDAGKHVYCEKPMTLTVEQAIEVRDAVKQYGKVFQVGPQRTALDKYWLMKDMIADGCIGPVTWAQGSWNRNPRVGQYFGTAGRRDDPVGPYMTGEDYINWDLWLGHEWELAQRIPWNPKHFFYFRGYFRYNGGLATDLLYHHLAPILLAVTGENGQYPTRVTGNGGLYLNHDGREVPDVFMMCVDYPSGFSVQMESVLTNEFTNPCRIYGRHGTMEVTDATSTIKMMGSRSFIDEFKTANNDQEQYSIETGERRDMVGNLIDVIREGGKLYCNADLGCATMVAIKMAVEAYRQNKTLLWDAQAEKVVTA